MPHRDPVPPLAREVIDLYRGPLADVRFPDLDRDVLDVAEVELFDAQRDLEAAELALQRARDRVSEHVASLTVKAQRGLAYARVFAESHPELRQSLGVMSAFTTKRGELAHDASSKSAPRRARRPRKESVEGAGLFEGPLPAASERAALGLVASEEETITNAA